VHLPAGLKKAEIHQLFALMRRAYREWPARIGAIAFPTVGAFSGLEGAAVYAL
jgi:hypothetical protein